MRFGLDVAQQRMPWDEVVSRVQFAEDLGFDGAWGFDHFQPMYGEGPGETFEGMTTLAALAGVTSRIRLGLLVTGVTYRHPSVFAAAGPHRRPRLARPARALARRGVVRQGAHRARYPVPVDAGAVRPARGRARDRDPAVHRRRRVLRRAGRVAARRVAPSAARAATAPADLDRRQRAAADAPPRRSLRRRVARVGDAELVARDERTARRARGRSGTRPVVDHAGQLAVARRPRHRPQARGKWRDAGYGYLVCGWPERGRAQIEGFARDVLPDFAD